MKSQEPESIEKDWTFAYPAESSNPPLAPTRVTEVEAAQKNAESHPIEVKPSTAPDAISAESAGARKLPPRGALSDSDVQKLEQSSISREAAERAGIFRVTHEAAKEFGFSPNGHGGLSGVLFPYRNLEGDGIRGYRLRRDHPDYEDKDGVPRERAKYLSRPGQSNFFYVPPYLLPSWMQDVSVQVVVTEGEKKCLAVDGLSFHGLGDAAETPRFVALGIAGAWCWKGRRQENGVREEVTCPIPDFDQITWKNRRVTLWPDSNFETNEGVCAGWKQLAQELKRRGAIVHFAYCPNESGINGPDDAIFKFGPEWGLKTIRDVWVTEEIKVEVETASRPGLRSSELPDWPAPMREEAFQGLAGEFVRLIEPETEADPVALLGNFLVASGVLFGRQAWTEADGRKHFPVEYLLMAGSTGTGRKGTATNRVLPVIESAEDGFKNRVLGGLSSGEGLVKAISPKEGESADEVRRFLVLLPEFASLLEVMTRQGNTMSANLREAWDGGRLRVTTRKEPLDVDNVNLSVIAHITPSELLTSLTATDRANGFGNRFLIVCVRRSKFLPEGGSEVQTGDIVRRLREAIARAQGRGQIRRNDEARELWASEYPRLTRGREGLKGALCSRAEAHALRLSLMYALLDGADAIRVEHLKAALAVWAYCEASVEHIFGGATGDPAADRLLAELARGPKTLSELHPVFGNNRESDWLQAKLAQMVTAGTIEPTFKDGVRKAALPAWRLKIRNHS
jgi:hypothetical protein